MDNPYFKAIQDSISKKNWSDLRCAYCFAGEALYKEKRYNDALPFYLLVKYFDFSGLDNQNIVHTVDEIEFASMTSISNTIRKCLKWTKQDKAALDNFYEKAMEMCPPIPFHYLPNETVLEIIKRELDGYEFQYDDYKDVVRKPSNESGKYVYWDITDLDGITRNMDKQQ